MRFLLCFLYCAIPLLGQAQILDPVKWTFNSKKINESEYDLLFEAKIDKNWYVYSQFLEGDEGPVPTSFAYKNGPHFSLVGKCKEQSAHRKELNDPLFDNMKVIKFSESVTFVQRVKVNDPNKVIRGELEFMTCDNTQCLPPTTVPYEFRFQAGAAPTAVAPVAPTNNVVKPTVSPAATSGIAATTATSSTETPVTSNVPPVSSPDNKLLEPVKWAYSVEKVSATEFDLLFKATIEAGWHTYSQTIDGDGPVPTSFVLEDGGNATVVGLAKEESAFAKKHLEPMFGIELTDFEKEVTFRQRIKVKDPKQPVKGYFEYMVCDKSRCLPPKITDFQFDVEKLTGGAVLDAAAAPTADGSNPVLKHQFDHSDEKTNCETTGNAPVKEDTGLWWTFVLGFLGGLVALLTPCVFPMIPLTVSYFLKSSTNRASGIRNALTYGLSIIGIYVGLGLLITGVFGADALNQLSTNVWFNIFLFVMLIVFAISFFGYFEITLPESWANKSDRAADKGGFVGIFFMAFTLAIVSFSCTGPLIGTLLVGTANASNAADTLFGYIPLHPLVGMFGFALALALPFGLFAAFPAWLNSLPKSGGWMNDVKVTLGFIEIALAFKFLSVADLTMGWKILPYELFVAVWVLCGLALALYFWGKLSFSHYGKITRSTGRNVLGGIALLVAAYCATGFQYSSVSETFVTPNLLSGLAPPAGHSYIYPKECPLNISCFHDFDEGLAYAKQVGKPILLDFTGYGCVNCRRMEDNVWGKEGVFELISDKYVLISLYVDDRKALDEKAQYTSSFSNRLMKTVGNKWADFQAIHFNCNSQPYYVLLSDDLKILNQPRGYTPDIAEYKAFLECGVNNYQKGK